MNRTVLFTSFRDSAIESATQANRTVSTAGPRSSTRCRSSSSSSNSNGNRSNSYVTNSNSNNNNGRSRGRSRSRVRRRRCRRSPRGSYDNGSTRVRITTRTSTGPPRRSRAIGSNGCTGDNRRRSVRCSAIATACDGT